MSESVDTTPEPVTGSGQLDRGTVVYLPGAYPDVRDAPEFAEIDRVVTERLRRSQLSSAEITDLLVANGTEADKTPAWIQHYRRLGYIDDEALALRIVETWQRKHRGRAAIMRELLRRKIPPEIADTALRELDSETEREAAILLARERVKRLTDLDAASVSRRLFGFLQRRGYEAGTIKEAIEVVMAEPD